jgi:hypothetical protein
MIDEAMKLRSKVQQFNNHGVFSFTVGNLKAAKKFFQAALEVNRLSAERSAAGYASLQEMILTNPHICRAEFLLQQRLGENEPLGRAARKRRKNIEAESSSGTTHSPIEREQSLNMFFHDPYIYARRKTILHFRRTNVLQRRDNQRFARKSDQRHDHF